MFIIDNLYDIIVFLDVDSIIYLSLTNKKYYLAIEGMWKHICNLRYNKNQSIFIPYMVKYDNENDIINDSTGVYENTVKILFSEKCNCEKDYEEITRKLLIEEFICKKVKNMDPCVYSYEITKLIEYCSLQENYLNIDNSLYETRSDINEEKFEEKFFSCLNKKDLYSFGCMFKNKKNVFNVSEKVSYVCIQHDLTYCFSGSADSIIGQFCITFNNSCDYSEKELMINNFDIIYCIVYGFNVVNIDPIAVCSNKSEIVLNIIKYVKFKLNYKYEEKCQMISFLENKVNESNLFDCSEENVEILSFELENNRKCTIYGKIFNL